ncbi:hypothetical protein [Roseomonas indoligenes]|uniref:Proteophosphoglycan ppg4 n=1 Tax=Roseomonas indoligenes TaxID=2820811 RepID=A0A940MXG7_9PROT|nr:hypothetical protein [Pararoseomonas indoligenes]MBP0495199.1 hypothetical protein [Pararoseomonas indoligenes]
MKTTTLALALAAGLIAAPAFAQVSTAPTPSAPGGVTRDQGAGAPGMAASPAAPLGSAGGPPNPQAGAQGTQPQSQQGGSGSN